MSAVAVALVLASGFIHAVWNLFAKRSLNKYAFLWFCQLAAIVLFLPPVLLEIPTIEAVPAVGWLWLAASMGLHGAYVLLLARTYTMGDLSQVYPIMRGVSPLMVPVIGVFVLGEYLRPLGWAGVACIVAGIFTAGGVGHMRQLKLNGPVLFAVAVGLMIASYTVVDKIALAYFPAFTLNEATNIGNLAALTYAALKTKALSREWRVNWRMILLGGLLAPGGYILFLKALELMPVAQLAPMREIGTVFGALLGVFLLKESQGKSRIAASILITLGIILLAQ